MKYIILFFTLSLILASKLQANNVSVSNFILRDQNKIEDCTFIQLDLCWDNSWRDEINWDAVWLFVKYCETDSNWRHATLNADSTTHLLPEGFVCSVGTTPVSGLESGKGVFIYRKANGSGTSKLSNIKLRWEYGIDQINEDARLTIKVFAIEMVYIPEGAFVFCDYGMESASRDQATRNPDISPTGNFRILNSEWRTGQDEGGYFIDSPADIPNGAQNGWPNGFLSFYLMKYEISQQQYCDFLNCLSREEQNKCVSSIVLQKYALTASSIVKNRNSIRVSTVVSDASIEFGCDFNNNNVLNEKGDGQTIACNWTCWNDFKSFASWCGLRPMTEMEYEKACRGPENPGSIADYAWGTDAPLALTPEIENDGCSDAKAISIEANCNYGNNLTGPVRCGLFAENGTTRLQAGAGYYGNMELSGNCCEHLLNCAFSKVPSVGDGNASYDEENWPDCLSGKGVRGLGWRFSNIKVSYRGNIAWDGCYRTQNLTIRLARTAPGK